MDTDSAREHDPPPVPIKTYKWEDVRREKMAGIYPWTHVLKPPFDENDFKTFRGRKSGRRQESKESRDSSVSSSGREVRCGCQYFQSDSLLPERHTLVGTRPSSRNMGDHEYEPISPPQDSSQPALPPPLLKVTDQEGQEKTSEEVQIEYIPTIDRSEHTFLRIPLDRDLVIPIDKAEIESIRYEDEEEGHEHEHKHEHQHQHEMSAQEIQDQMEERFFAATPTTSISRTDGEFNTSQMDSSGLDELPLKRDARRGFNAKGFQQKIQSQAGRLRTRIRNISRPKINFPERPKLHLPERPKFNFPERPKFNIKKPDIKLPNFNFGKTKTSSIRRPLRDRSQIQSNQSTVGSKKNIFDSIHFRTYPRIFSKKKKAGQGRRAMTPPPRMETESTPPSSPASRTGPINQRWSQRFKDIKFADEDDNQSDLKKPSFDDDVEDDSAPFRDSDFKTAVMLTDKKQIKTESISSIPGSDKEQHSSGSSSERHRTGVIEEIDSDEFFLRQKGLSREDVDVSRYLSLEIRDAFRSPKNALAKLDTELYDDDNEGYDYKPSKIPLGEPIRLSMEAIRNRSLEQIRMSPEKDIEYDEELREEPVRPERSRSLKKGSSKDRSEEKIVEVENSFKTYPPNRPTRVRKQSSQSKQSIPYDDYSEYEKENKLLQTDEDKKQSVQSLVIADMKKEFSPTRYIDESSEALHEPWQDEPQPPLPPKRRKSTRDSSADNESLNARNYNRDQWLEDEQNDDMVLDNMNALGENVDENIILQNGHYDSPPPLPIRKSRSRGTSLADEDRTSRGADSLISETRTHLTEDLEIKPDFKTFIPDDYAVIEKTVIESKPIAAEKPIRPPPPNRKTKTAAQLTALKNQSINFFFTYPRRAIKKTLHKQSAVPTRPIRNYSTIGPSRPPRRNRVFREPVYEGEFIPLKDESEIISSKEEQMTEFTDLKVTDSIELQYEDDRKIIEKLDQEIQEIRNLQSGDVIEKMKSRPLPPPPRPPRKTKEDSIDTAEDDEEVEVVNEIKNRYIIDSDDKEVTDLDEVEDVVIERIDILVGHPDFQEKIKPPKEEVISGVHKEPTFHEKNVSLPEPVEEPPIKAERRKKSLSITRTAHSPYVPDTIEQTLSVSATPVEASVSTQTDVLPEGFYLEDEDKLTEEYTNSKESTIEKKNKLKECDVPKRVETIVEHKVVVIPTPETEILKAKKIHVAELEVEKLNVSELQANKITVSDIDGVTMQVSELSSKSGHLVISGFELPASFLEAITPPPLPAPIIQIQSSTQTPPETVDSQTNTVPQEECPLPRPTTVTTSQGEPSQKPRMATPPPPQKRPSPPPPVIVIQTPQGQSSPVYVPGYIPSSPPPKPSSRSRTHGHESTEEMRMLSRRRRHHSQKHSNQISSDEEDDTDGLPVFPVARRIHQHEPTSVELIKQLFSIWQASVTRGMQHMVEGLNRVFPEGEKRKDAQTAACIILVLIAGLIILGFGPDKTVHHHHWDFLPPQ